MKYYNPLLLAIVLIISLSFFSCPGHASDKTEATLTKISGQVTVFESGADRGMKGELGLPISVGYIIATIGEKSSADVTFPNESVVRIMPDTRLEIKESYFAQKTFRVRMKLIAGKIFNVGSR